VVLPEDAWIGEDPHSIGVQRVGLAASAAGLAVGPVDLEHDLAMGDKQAGQGGAVAAGALHTPGVDLAQTLAQASRSR
jgi:hypothetical protein